MILLLFTIRQVQKWLSCISLSFGAFADREVIVNAYVDDRVVLGSSYRFRPRADLNKCSEYLATKPAS